MGFVPSKAAEEKSGLRIFNRFGTDFVVIFLPFIFQRDEFPHRFWCIVFVLIIGALIHALPLHGSCAQTLEQSFVAQCADYSVDVSADSWRFRSRRSRVTQNPAWETDFLPLLVLTRQGRSTGKNQYW